MAENEDLVFKPPQPVVDVTVHVVPPPDLPPPLTDKNPPNGIYFLEIMKNGNIISRVDVISNRISFGRSREADVSIYI